MTNLIGTLRQTARTLAITLFVGCSFIGTAALAADPSAVQETVPAVQQARAGGELAPATGDSYAAREAKAPAELAAFQGGDTVVVIGGTTLIIVVLVILILILI